MTVRHTSAPTPAAWALEQATGKARSAQAGSVAEKANKRFTSLGEMIQNGAVAETCPNNLLLWVAMTIGGSNCACFVQGRTLLYHWCIVQKQCPLIACTTSTVIIGDRQCQSIDTPYRLGGGWKYPSMDTATPSIMWSTLAIDKQQCCPSVVVVSGHRYALLGVIVVAMLCLILYRLGCTDFQTSCIAVFYVALTQTIEIYGCR